MELRNVETFVMAVENKSFSKAAELLGYTQSTVTFHIKQLESEFGVLLFERIGRKIALTEEGERFYEHAIRIIKDVKDAQQDLDPDPEPHGLLRLGSVNSLSTLHLPGLLMELHRRYPKIDTLVESEAPPLLFDMLRHNELDLLYLLGGGPLPDDMISVYEHKEPRSFLVKKNHPLTKKKKVTLSDILSCDFVSSPKTSQMMTDLARKEGLKFKPYLIAGTPDLLLHIVEDSDAVTHLPDFTAKRYIDEGRLKKIHVPGIDEYFLIKIIYHKNKWVTPQMKAFISLL